MKKLTRQELEKWMDKNERFTLIETLPRENFEEFHLPGAVNVANNDQFQSAIVNAVPNKQTRVVVYCANTGCQSSADAAEKMDKLGYTDVYDYEAGKEDWKEAGLEVRAGAGTSG